MSSRPRIVHVISDLDRGGSELHLSKLLPHLQLQYDNHVACLIGRGPVGQILERNNIPTHYLNISTTYDPRGIGRLEKLIRYLKPRAIVANLIYADICARLATSGHNIPLISNQRSCLPGRPYLRLIDRATRRAVTHFVVQTTYMKDIIQNKIGVPVHRISIIPNLVESSNPTVSRRHIRQQLNLKTRSIVITCVSNLRPYKGHATLLHAFRKVVYSLPARRTGGPTTNYQLLLIGSGPLQPALEKQAGELGISQHVHFLGSRKDINNILAASDIFVLPSEAEGMSNALLEAMAARLPCLATKIPSNQALITHPENGLLFEVGNSDILAHHLVTLSKEKPYRQRIGHAAEQYVTIHHSPRLITSAWHSLLTSLL